ncbi:flagellar hook-associated protein FlgL [Flocculibacter collagenilyticus]|uniref:flagellar hook-associated protein FlgL n=1 Tax=Flocculibacter collagenilyticus TaxID=2744479 RepID=UPI0018F7CF3C|nr:flagellar hook-associated protein FlgL [Flocculibacter collagenilyticus]
MRIGTANFFERNVSQLQERQFDLDRAQEELASGKKVINPSDDPVASNSIIKLKREIETSDRYLKAQDAATRFNNGEETALISMTNILWRVQELMTQSINGALDEDARLALQLELSSRMREFEGLANEKNANGDYMFSGFQTRTEPYQKDGFGYHQYQGDDGQRDVLIAASYLVGVNDPGSNFIDNVEAYSPVYEPVGPAASGALVSTGFVTDITEHSRPVAPYDNFQIQFSDPGTGLEWQVVQFDSTGVAVPNPGTDIVAGPYSYAPGDDITFQGITVKTDPLASPVAGDTFNIQEKNNDQTTNILWIMQQAVDALSVSGTNYTAQANVGSAINVTGGNIVSPDDHNLADFEISFPAPGEIQIDEVDRSTIPATVIKTHLPAPPATSQPYDPLGTDLRFNGIEIRVTGVEIVGDTLRLDRPENTRRNDLIGSLIGDLKNGMTNIDNVRSDVGARLNAIANEDQAIQRFQENVKETLAELEEIDIYEAIKNMELSRTGLQAAQQSFAKIQNLSLFDFI